LRLGPLGEEEPRSLEGHRNVLGHEDVLGRLRNDDEIAAVRRRERGAHGDERDRDPKGTLRCHAHGFPPEAGEKDEEVYEGMVRWAAGFATGLVAYRRPLRSG